MFPMSSIVVWVCSFTVVEALLGTFCFAMFEKVHNQGIVLTVASAENQVKSGGLFLMVSRR